MKVNSLTAIIVVSGQTGSGKTSLAKELVQKLDADFASFGSFVRSEAIQRGIEEDRISLQNLGQSLIDEQGPNEFVKKVLAHGQKNGKAIMVLDGVRSVEIWRAVEKLISRSILIYLDIEESKRTDRLIKRDNLHISSIHEALHHPMEVNIPELKQHADLVLHSSPIDVMVLEIMRLLDLKGVMNPSS